MSIKDTFSHLIILTVSFINLIQKKEKKQKKIEMFLINIVDIEKVLILRKKIDSKILLLKQYYKFLNVFNYIMTEKLLLLREKEMNYHIKLKEIDKKKLKIL